MRRLGALLLSDLRNTVRDDVLPILTGIPVVLALMVRFGEPYLRAALLPSTDLTIHHGTIATVLTVLTPLVYGWAVGFMLLDDRDEHVLIAIAVTPLSKSGYLFYRITFLVLFSQVLNMVLVPLAGLSGIRFGRFVVVSIMASLEAPLLALALASLSSNKVAGLAIAKFAAVFVATAVLPFYIDSPLIYVGGIAPYFWVGRAIALIEADRLAFLLAAFTGLVVHVAYLVLLVWLFDRRVE